MTPSRPLAGGPVLITGGAGFIGSNLADRILQGGEPVRIVDDLSRPLVSCNAGWLKARHGDRVELRVVDVRDREAIRAACEGASFVYHFAAQVAVTTSVIRPLEDFDINARGTLNVLEAIRSSGGAPLLFTSTNKVYGSLPEVALRRRGDRYEPEDARLRGRGISESHALDFHSPYGCSKGAADQYVLDYARTYGLSATVFRMSCIYGPRQFGSEEQGWVAHFLLRAIRGEAITLYGDGMQVRDLLYIDDLVSALLMARRAIGRLAGAAFNIGGGPGSTSSLLELVGWIEELEGRRPELRHEGPRPGDQRYYVSDHARFSARTGWAPEVRPRDGVRRLHGWLRETVERPLASAGAEASR